MGVYFGNANGDVNLPTMTKSCIAFIPWTGVIGGGPLKFLASTRVSIFYGDSFGGLKKHETCFHAYPLCFYTLEKIIQ